MPVGSWDWGCGPQHTPGCRSEDAELKGTVPHGTDLPLLEKNLSKPCCDLEVHLVLKEDLHVTNWGWLGRKAGRFAFWQGSSSYKHVTVRGDDKSFGKLSGLIGAEREGKAGAGRLTLGTCSSQNTTHLSLISKAIMNRCKVSTGVWCGVICILESSIWGQDGTVDCIRSRLEVEIAIRNILGNWQTTIMVWRKWHWQIPRKVHNEVMSKPWKHLGEKHRVWLWHICEVRGKDELGRTCWFVGQWRTH